MKVFNNYELIIYDVMKFYFERFDFLYLNYKILPFNHNYTV